jgi:hypothetical protein
MHNGKIPEVENGLALFKSSNNGQTQPHVYKMCSGCRTTGLLHVRHQRMKRKRDMQEYTKDDTRVWKIKFPRYAQPRLDAAAAKAPTVFLHEMDPVQWCRAFRLLSLWENNFR